MFLPCILITVAVAGGTLLTLLFRERAPLSLRLAMGTCIGLALQGSFGLVLSPLLGLTAGSVILSSALLLLPVALLLKERFRGQMAREVHSAVQETASRDFWRPALFYVVLAVMLGFVFSRNMVQRPDGIYTEVANNIGDLPFHLQVISSFVYGHNIPIEDPMYSGVRFTYPVLADFLTAMLVRAGASLASGMWLQNMMLVLGFIGLLHHWTRSITGNRLAAVYAPLLVIFSGGLGWWLVAQDLRASDGGLITLLGQLPHDYTIAGGSIFRWGNSVTTLLLPQRSFLFGLPLALCVWHQWWAAIESSNAASSPKERRYSPFFPSMLGAGLCAALLPLVHTHGFVVVIGAGACLTLIFRPLWRGWLLFFAVAMLGSLPGLVWLFHGSAIHSKQFISWQTGWDRGNVNPFWFWFANTGFFIPLLLAAIFWWRSEYTISRRAAWLYAPFAFCFILPNLLKLSPWIWDNIKFLFYWYVASAPLVAFILARLWQRRRNWLAAGLLVTLTLSGALDIWRVLSGAGEIQEFSRDGIQMANLINLLAPPQAMVLHAPTWNSPAYLTGRRTALGYAGWIWSRGLETAVRDADINRTYAGGPLAAALLSQYKVDYVLVGPAERGLAFNSAFWARCSKLAEIGSYQLYKPDCK